MKNGLGDRREINIFYKKTLKELKHATGLKPKSLIEQVGLRKICEEVLPKAKIVEETRFEFAKKGTVEALMIFMDRFYGLRFDHYN